MAKKFKHKYCAVRCERGAIKFPSLLERAVYDRLKWWESAGKLRMVLRQTLFDLPGGVKHFVDFQVFTDEEVLFVEAKGRDLETGKMKRLMCEEICGIEIHVVKCVHDVDKLVARFVKAQ